MQIKFTEEGKNTLRNIHIGNQKEIKSEIKGLIKNPQFGKKLTGNLIGFYSLRFKKYRVIYSLQKDLVIIHRVGHRKDVYGEAIS